MLNQEAKPAVTIEEVVLTFQVTTSDGRKHVLEVVTKDTSQPQEPLYMGNNAMLDKQLAAMLKNIDRRNTGLI